nr:radical SAM protein [uncultured Aminipila sp.]
MINAKLVSDHSHDRQPLHEILPLNEPLSLTILASSYCNFKCNYCIHKAPSDKFKKIQGEAAFLSILMTKKIVQDLKDKNVKLKRIILAGYGEPLLNPNIAEIVSILKKSDVTKETVIVSNGTMLSHSLSDELIESGLDLLRISIQGMTNSSYKNESGVDVDLDNIIDNIKYFYEHKKSTTVYIKIMEEQLENDFQKDKFFNIFGKICDEISIEKLAPITETTSASYNSDWAKTINGQEIKESSVCATPFYSLHIIPNGDTCSCCYVDNLTVFGNVLEENIIDIWHNDIHRQLLIGHLSSNRDKIKGCNICVSDKYTMRAEDQLTEYANELLGKYV